MKRAGDAAGGAGDAGCWTLGLQAEVGSVAWQLAFIDALWLASLASPEDMPLLPPC